MNGLTAATLTPAMRSVNIARVVRRVGVDSLHDFRGLDLSALDASTPRNRVLYTTAALAEGSATAIAVTGAEVASTVTAGTTLAVAAGAIAADAATSVVLLGRITAHVAAQYGYDVSQPEEEIFALGVISLGSAGSPAAKVSALASLSRLTQQMMRRAVWAELNSNAMVKLIDAMFRTLGFRLTKQKLGQAVPVLGVVINGGMSAEMADRTYRRARDAYRLRFLSDKYDIDPADWLTGSPDQVDDEVIDIALDAHDELAPENPITYAEEEPT